MESMTQSAEIGDLISALTKVQAELQPIKKDKINPFFKSKYITLESVVETSRLLLSNNDLAIIQTMAGEPGSVGVTTTLAHTSGQWIRGTLYLPLSKQDPQGAGSAITYARRYSHAAILGLVPDEDDDGNEASTPASGKPIDKLSDPDKDKLKRLYEYLTALNSSEDVAKQTILEDCNVKATANIAPGTFSTVWGRYVKDVEEFEQQTGGK